VGLPDLDERSRFHDHQGLARNGGELNGLEAEMPTIR
jgi:hypothetical protein